MKQNLKTASKRLVKLQPLQKKQKQLLQWKKLQILKIFRRKLQKSQKLIQVQIQPQIA